MASTSTNKQPLLVDRVLHYAVSTETHNNDGYAPSGNNSAVLLVNAIGTDGCIIEDIYSVSLGGTAAEINLYISTANDYMRKGESVFIGSFSSKTTAGQVSHFGDEANKEMPRTLNPVPHVGDDSYNHALYIPKGRALWAARNSTDSLMTDAPIIGCQGGWY